MVRKKVTPRKRGLPQTEEQPEKTMAVLRRPWVFPFPFKEPKPGKQPFPEEEEE